LSLEIIPPAWENRWSLFDQYLPAEDARSDRGAYAATVVRKRFPSENST
jgi:hypothetical protein